ncbi:TrmH family RNA methyltransferase, partial [Anaerofustis stercorihominis]
YISSTKTPQGVLAVLETKYCDINDINKNDNILYLDTVQDPENVGGLIRSSVCTDFDAVILNSSASPFLSKAVRASAGSIINTKIILDEDYKILKTLKEKGFDIIASTLNGKEDITLNKKNNVLIVGNEGNGISDECLKYATKEVKIPMSGKCESLNANVSGSILMYKIYGFL